ncbi:hypothetical protein ARMGADRAFT_1038726 [Armillaria gallica]|uniref:Uncharacterized protein n=1 Tax=Armillaria gallica TaxID=47427 RepID=A0A2H3D441_ARMGA|nr:hypothetical protein ARMGADRAFT_1038726 [Armillaria gallica]
MGLLAGLSITISSWGHFLHLLLVARTQCHPWSPTVQNRKKAFWGTIVTLVVGSLNLGGAPNNSINKNISGLFRKPFLSSELHWPFLNPTPARLPRLRLSPLRESSSMPTNPAVLARARLVDAAIERKKEAMNGSVSALDEVRGAQIFPAYIEELTRQTLHDHGDESGQGLADSNSDFFSLWPVIRAWSLHFISVCTSKSPSVSESMLDFDLTAMKTVTAMCLQSLARHLSYYKTITANSALHPHLVEFWRESCHSCCHVMVHNLSSLLYSIMVLQEAQWIGRFPLGVNPEETARLSFNSVLEDYVDGAWYNDDDLNGCCLSLMRLMCKSPILGEAIIHEETVRLTCTLMGKYAVKICGFFVVMVDNHVLEILSVNHHIARSIASLDKKGFVMDTRHYTPDMVCTWKDLNSLSQNCNVIKEGCNKLPNICFATHWKSEHKDKCIKSNISLKDRKYLAYLAQTTILKNKGTLSPIISDYMNEFSITERASLAIEVDFCESPTCKRCFSNSIHWLLPLLTQEFHFPNQITLFIALSISMNMAPKTQACQSGSTCESKDNEQPIENATNVEGLSSQVLGEAQGTSNVGALRRPNRAAPTTGKLLFTVKQAADHEWIFNGHVVDDAKGASSDHNGSYSLDDPDPETFDNGPTTTAMG